MYAPTRLAHLPPFTFLQASRNDDPIKLARETLESVSDTVELLEGCVKEHIRVGWVRKVEGYGTIAIFFGQRLEK